MAFNKMTIDDLDIAGKRVIVRVDFNVPLAKDGTVADDYRIRKALPTINKIVDSGSVCILMSHLGRPKGKPDPALSLKPVADRLAKIMKKKVAFVSDCIGPEVEAAVEALDPGGVILLENLRFHKEEKEGSEEFAKKLASLADVYVNDAFGTAHRAHASTTTIAKFLPSAAGYLIVKELEFFNKALDKPEHPFVAVLGGAKVSDKIGIIEKLHGKVDALLVGGGMAFTFLLAKGYKIGNSLLDESWVEKARKEMDLYREMGVDFLLPLDLVCANEAEDDAKVVVTKDPSVPDGMMGLDIGPKTIALFIRKLREAKTVVWNGLMGVYEKKPFAEGTRALCEAIAELDATTIIEGGDSAAAVRQFGHADAMSHVSTGGGASLELFKGNPLPGIEALPDR